ncbi:MAG: BamA/TamA family outer membrane protein [Gemmatimonadota bacterium]
MRSRAAAWSVACLSFIGVPIAAQLPEGVPPDTFLDEGARALVAGAYGAIQATEGLESYEAQMTERMRVGVRIGGRTFGRERTLYHRERLARVRWAPDDGHVVRWIGSRTTQPVVGESLRVGRSWLGEIDIEDELALRDIAAPLLFEPGGDRLDLFDAGFIQPISRQGLEHYTFASGDTLRVSLPPPNRSLELIEVHVRPRTEEWESVVGSLWFDAGTGVLARAAFRPSGVWDEQARNPGSLDGVPGFILPGIGRVDTIVLEYALFEQRWWLPRKMLGRGVFNWGSGIVSMPLEIEWVVSDYWVNEAPTDDLLPPESDRARRTLRGRGPGDVPTITYTPSAEELRNAPELPEPLGSGELLSFDSEELDPLVDRLTQVAGAPIRAHAPSWRRRILHGARYDRVRALSLGTTFDLGAVGRSRWYADVRVGTADVQPTGALRVTDGQDRPGWWMQGYSRFADASHPDRAAGSFGNSVSTLLVGQDDGEYYRTRGATAGRRVGGTSFGLDLEVFAEDHRSVDTGTRVSVADLWNDGLRANIRAAEGRTSGLRIAASGQYGLGSETPAFQWELRGEGATGDFEYARTSATVVAIGPLGSSLSGVVQLNGGTTFGSPPVQRHFFLGGTSTLRGFRGGTAQGTAYWLAKAEVGGALPGLRGAVFVDAGWAGPRERVPTTPRHVGVGAGASLFDGLLRIDLGRGVRGGGGWRLHIYTSGLF